MMDRRVIPRSTVRAPRVLALVLAICVPCAPADAAAQELVPLPEIDRSGVLKTERALYLYYVFSKRGELRPGAFDRFCDADQGDLCYEGDHESFCRKFRCNSRERQADFVEKLGENARSFPNSVQAVGQAVYAAVRLGHPDRAADFVEICAPAGEWWCDLLRGYVLHRSGRSAEAAAPFERGLERAPADVRCRLTDVSDLLDGSASDAYGSVPCGERDDIQRHLWWLSDPLHVEPGNDRWTEHLSRRFMLMFHELRIGVERIGQQRGHVLQHRESHERSVVRRGFQDSWRLDDVPTYLRWAWPELAGFRSRAGAANHFVPERPTLRGLDENLAYDLEADFGDEGYTRRDGRMAALPAQLARFRQADSLQLAFATHLTPVLRGLEADRSEDEAAPPAEGIHIRSSGAAVGQAFFVLSERPGHAATLDPVPIDERLAFAPVIADRPQLVGVEVLTPSLTARHRAAVLPLGPDGRALSDVLLFREVGPELPQTRLRAIGQMLATTQVTRARPVGAYWEAYGLEVGDEVRIAIRVQGEGGDGLLSRLGRAVGLGPDPRGVISWTETVEEVPFRRSVTLATGDLDEGGYELVVTLTFPDGERLSRSRTIDVVDDDAVEGSGGG